MGLYVEEEISVSTGIQLNGSALNRTVQIREEEVWVLNR